MNSSFIVFDLDGTLINTLYGINDALNKTLEELNIPYKYSLIETESFIGNGAKVLFEKALKRPFSNLEYDVFLKNYEKYQYISPLYPNVLETLIKLKSKGYKLFCNSNKPNTLLIKLMKEKFKDDINLFTDIQGDSSKFNRKPSADYIDYILKKYNLSKNDSYYVGDSVVDLNTAKNAGLISIIVSYGYGDKNFIKDQYIKAVIQDFADLLKIIK